MKSSIFVLFILMFSQYSYAQQGLEITATFTPAYSTLLNKNDLKVANMNSYEASFGFHAGATIGHNFSDYVGIATGVGVSSMQQNYIQADTRDLINELQFKSSRNLSYFRIPVLMRIGSNPEAKHCFYMRFGPHVDILMTANSKTSYPINYNIEDEIIDYTSKKDYNGKPQEVFSPAVFGVTMELGAKIGITEQIGLLFLAHFETSISNVDGKAAPAHFQSSSKLVNARFGKVGISERAQTYSLLGGLTVGLHFTPFYYGFKVNRNKNRSRYKFHKWN